MHRRHFRPLAIACLTAPALAASAVAQSPEPQRPRSPWRFGTEIAFTDITGNRQLQLFQSTFTAVRQTPETFTLDFKVEARYGESNHVEAARSAAARTRLDWTPRARVSPFLGLDWDYDRIRKIDSRIAGGMGANINIGYQNGNRTTLALGLVVEYEDRMAGVTPATKSDVRLHSRFAFQRALRPGVGLEFNLKYQPATREMSDYLFKADGALRVALTTRLSWRTSYVWNRDSTPATGVVSKDDRQLVTGLLIQW